MAPPISDAVIVDVLRRVDRLVTPLARRLGRPPALPAGRARPVVGRPGARGSPPASSAAPALRRQAGRPAAPAEHGRRRRSSRSSSWAWPASTASTTPPSGCPCSPASCSTATSPPSGCEPLLTRAKGTYRERRVRRARGRQGARAPPHAVAGRRPARPDRRRPRRPPQGQAAPPGAGQPARSSACSAATPPSGRACAAPRAQTAATVLGRPRRRRQRRGLEVGGEVGVHLTRRRRPVHGDEVDAGHALVQQRAAELGGHLDAERPHRRLVLRPVAVERGEPLGEVGRERLPGQLHDPGDLPRVGHRHDPGDDRHVAGPVGDPVAHPQVVLGPEEHLGDREVGARAALAARTSRRRCRSPASAGAARGRRRRRPRSRPST